MKKEIMRNLTPSQIVSELKKYIIGQEDAKRAVAIALRNRWRRQQVEEGIKEEIMPNNIILIGPTGVGKTEIARRLAKLTGAPFYKVEASKFTEVGPIIYFFNSLTICEAELSVNMVKSEETKLVQEKAERIAEEKILDILIPPVRATAKPAGEPENGENDENIRNEKTRDWMREKLKKGELDEKLIEFDTTTASLGMQVVGPFGMDDMGMNIQEIIGNMMPKKKKKRKTTIKDARKVMAHEEAQKLIDMDNVQKEAVTRVEEAGIVFLDEIDKVAGSSKGGHGGPDVSREGVQRDLLPIVEGSTVNTKYGPVKTDHILFLASGAFHIAKPSDLIPELQGRFPIRVELKSLTEEDFKKLLTLPENALLKQYAALLDTEKVKITFEEDAIREIARTATIVNEEVENIGARRLHTILTTLLEDILFDVPDKMPEAEIKINGKMVNDKLEKIVKNRDLSKYIL